MEDSSTFDRLDGIAIIGMAGRFPGASNVDEFWQNLRDGVESISFFSDAELKSSGVSPAISSKPDYVRARGVVEGAEMFDASYFGFSPREAVITDPQQRIFLECASEALENAGYNSEAHKGSVGVYAGVGVNTYLFHLYSNPRSVKSAEGFQIVLGNDKDYLATRVSYKLNLKGPSINVQTACSTSLVAVCLACQSLSNYQCDMALAGGVSVKFPQKAGYLYRADGINSPDGHCRAFDALAKGTVGGSGVGIVVLKRAEDARADGDYIHAIIKGSAINNDGSTKVGYTAPSVDAQADVIAMAQSLARVSPETISYIEAHGTGTSLGDPIEIAALTQVFRASTQKKGFCAIGSVKTNIGHLDPAAGIASLIKTVLALKHKMIPPSLHYTEPNPNIDLLNSPFYVNSKLSEWAEGETARRAGVSSFGIGGTNAHVIVEEAPNQEPSAQPCTWQLLVLSARTSSALDTMIANMVDYLRKNPDANLASVAYTLQVGREALSHRRIFVSRSAGEVVSELEAQNPKRAMTAIQEMRDRPVVFMFSGQGTQYVNMASELYQLEPTFREQIDLCSAMLKPHLGADLREILYPKPWQAEQDTQRLNQTRLTQPALFVLEYALAKMWMEWGVRPKAMIGHSIGEYVAACLAGVFSLGEALELVATRGRLMQGLAEGAMLSIALAEPEVRGLLGKQLWLAAVNGPSVCVVSGTVDAIDKLEKQLGEEGIANRRLHTSRAFHSGMTEPILEDFSKHLKKVELKPPQIPYVSNITGRWITTSQATDSNYWVKHLREAVRFGDGLAEVLKDERQVLLEIGPGQTLSTLVKRHPGKSADQVVLSSVRHPQERRSDEEFLLETLGKLWLAGVAVNWSAFHKQEQRHRLPLPTYPFERKRYWLESAPLPGGIDSGHASPGKLDVADWFYAPSWKRSTPATFAGQENMVGRTRRWLVFIDETGVGSRLVERLEQMNQRVISITVGEKFARISDSKYTLDPRRQDGYDSLVAELRQAGTIPEIIAHLWCITSNEDTLPGAGFFEKCQDLGFFSLLFLTQALGKKDVTDPIEIWVVSNNIHEITGDEYLCPEKATLLGPCQVIPQEYPNITCRNIDIATDETGAAKKLRLVNRLITELTADSSDQVVAYRRNHRWTRTFEPARLGGAYEDKDSFKDGGVYLITEGSGDLGFEIAEYIARRARAKLLLIEHCGLAAKGEREQGLSSGDGSEGAEVSLRRTRAEIEKRTGTGIEQEADYVTRMEEEIEKEMDIDGRNDRDELERRTNQLCSSYLFGYLATSNLGIVKGRICDREELKRSLRILPKFERFYDFMIRVLYEDEIIKTDNGTIEFLRDGRDITPPEILRKQMDDRYPAFVGTLNLLGHCANSYRTALTGEVEAISVLYPDGSSGFLKNKPNNAAHYSDSRTYLALVRRLVSRIVRQARGKKIRILEVGAGTGNLTGFVAPVLKEQNVEYHFTDLGRSFVLRAEKEAAKHGLSFMKFGALDISKDPAGQSYQEQSFDVVLGLNVVHATPNIEQAIKNLRKLIAPAGVMMLVELIKQQRRVDMVWGLADGWWQFEDTDLRKESPLLSLDKWEEVISKQGFKSVRGYPRNAAKRLKTDHALIIAHRGYDANADEHAERAKRIRDMEEWGAEVWTASLDISNREQIKRIVDQAHERFGKINAVIHTAGSGIETAIPEETPDNVWREFAPGVMGALALDGLLREKVDFFVLFSSLASILGRHGQVSRCAASAFLDAFAHKMACGHARRAVSIDWDEWASPGLAQIEKDSDDGQAAKSKYEEAITIEQGLESFNRILSGSTLAQVIVSPHNLSAAIDSLRPITTPSLQEETERAALGEAVLARPLQEDEHTGVMSELERSLAATWMGVLGVERVSAHDNFFDLGGDSLIAIQVMSRVREAFNVELPVRSLFDSPTLCALAEKIDATRRAEADSRTPAILPIPRDKALPLSYPQQQLWFLDQLQPNSSFYNLAAALRLDGPLKVAVLEQTFNEIIRRHEALRTTFSIVDGQPVQVISPAQAISLKVEDLSEIPDAEREGEVRRLAMEEALRPFDLAAGPVFRASLFRVTDREHMLLLTMHHIVSDGWSIGVLIREMTILYDSFSRADASPLPDLTVQYGDFAYWQRQWPQEKLKAELSYWKKQFGGNLPALQLPVDHPRPALQTYRGAHQPFRLSKNASESLKALSQKEGVTLFMTLLAAFKILLYRYTGADDIIVGSPIANRTRPELEPLIGFFANTLALRTDLSGEPTFRELLSRVREVSLGAYTHQDLPFEKLVEALQPERDLGRNPLFQVAFVLQNVPTSRLELSGLAVSVLELEISEGTAKFDWLLSLADTPQGLIGFWEYNKDLFDDPTIIRMIRVFEILLGSIVEYPGMRISQLPLMTAEEQHNLISASASSAKSRIRLPHHLKTISKRF